MLCSPTKRGLYERRRRTPGPRWPGRCRARGTAGGARSAGGRPCVLRDRGLFRRRRPPIVGPASASTRSAAPSLASTASCPVAANITDSSLASARPSSRDQAALAHDEHAVGHAEHLGQLGRDHEDGDAVRRQAATSAGGPRPWCRCRCRASARRRSAPAARSASHLASTTFCWLPPESVCTGSSRRWYLVCSRAVQSRARRRSPSPTSRPRRVSERSRVWVTLRWIERSMTRPCWRRSSGTSARPAAIAAFAECAGSSRPETRTVPESRGSTPNTARTTSERPAPTRPASATISPARTVNETSVKTPARLSPSTSSTTSPGSTSVFGKSVPSSRPTIRRTISSTVTSARGSVETWAPSRMIVTRSQSAVISSNRWEMNSTAAPASRSDRATPKRRSTSTPESAAVGSSMTTTRASSDSALAISTICWSAMERPRAGRSGSIGTPRRANSSAAAALERACGRSAASGRAAGGP